MKLNLATLELDNPDLSDITVPRYVPVTEDVDEFGGSSYDDDVYEPDMLSDLDYSVSGKPMAEWDGIYGRHWTTYETEEERQADLDRYEKELAEYEAKTGRNMTKPFEWVKEYMPEVELPT